MIMNRVNCNKPDLYKIANYEIGEWFKSLSKLCNWRFLYPRNLMMYLTDIEYSLINLFSVNV